MAKEKIVYFCSNCGYESSKWIGKCPSCNNWNTFVEEKVIQSSKKTSINKQANTPILLSEINPSEHQRLRLPGEELNRVLGGGFTPGSVSLLSGEPGIGKSTLLLQTALTLESLKVLYVAGEENKEQIKNRANRVNKDSRNLYLLENTDVTEIIKASRKLQTELLLVDSIQTIYSPGVDSLPGSISQIKECAGELIRYAKESQVPVVLVGHINKEGGIAGPKILEHIVDTVIHFEGDAKTDYRVLRTTKNRFGSTSEIGLFEMTSTGIAEVDSPADILTRRDEDNVSGSAIASTIEGNRPLFVEIQALVSTPVYSSPQRSPIGYNAKRLNMILAVLEKKIGVKLSQKDVFLNLVGGISLNDPAIDLAVIVALISSEYDISVPNNYAFAGEIGLAAELRHISSVQKRIAEAEKLGYKKIFIPKIIKSDIPKSSNIEILQYSSLKDLLPVVFKQ